MARKRRRRDNAESFADAQPQAPRQPRLTPTDVQQKVFRLAFRGYNERDVDEFLDHVTETLAELHEENKRLREAAQEGRPGAAPGAVAAAERQAAEVVRKAREHAARLVEEAERRAADTAAVPSPQQEAASASFLVREREFLQRLASLIQSHGRSLKEEAQRARREADGAGGTEAVGGPPPPAPTQPPPGAVTETRAAEPPDVGGADRSPMDEAPRAAEPGPSMAVGSEPPGGEEATASPSPAEEGPPAPPEAGRGEPGAPPAGTGAPQPPPPGPPVIPTAGPSAGEGSGAPPQETAPPSSEQRGDREAEDAPTAPWRPPESGAPADAGWSLQEPGDEGDPLLSAWESAFVSRPEEDAGPEQRPRGEGSSGGDQEDADAGEEPSLRELFWGEE